MTRQAIHWSHLARLAKCGHAFFLAYIVGLKVRPGIAIATGSAVHDVAARNLRSKAAGEGLHPIEAIRDFARDAWSKQWEEGIALLPQEIERGASQVKGEAIDRTIQLSIAHATKLAPSMRPKLGGVERAWRLEVEGFPFDIEGELDLQEAREGSLPSSIRDLKTAKRTPSPRLAGKSGQLATYAIAVETLDGEIPDLMGLDFVAGAEGSIRTATFITRFTEQHRRAFWARLENAAELITAQHFAPADPYTDPMCDPRYCGFARNNPDTGRPYCKFYADAPVSVVVPGSVPTIATGGFFNGSAANRRSKTIGTAATAQRDELLAGL